MAPIEFEKQIKERLEDRKIKPSDAAWKKVQDKIEVTPVAKKPGIFRYAVAAAIVGVLLSIFWISDTVEQDNLDSIPVVEQPVLPPADQDKIEEFETKSITEPVEVAETKATDKEPAAEYPNTKQNTVADQSLALAEEQKIGEDEVFGVPTEEIIDQKIAEVIAQVNLLENNQDAVTDAEVDSLLRNAQQELMAERAIQSQLEVDAAELLAGVEEELDQSFRDQVFERLKNGYIKVRTAVADRNN